MNDSPSDIETRMDFGNDYADIREQVSNLCSRFPGEYWRNLEGQPVESSYPTDFINALTEAGYLAALIPEEYGGAGLPVRGGAVILETINRMGCSAAAGHAQMYTMGTVLRHGSEAQKQRYLPENRSRRVAATGIRGDGADVGIGYHTNQDPRRTDREWICDLGTKSLDQPRPAL